MGKLFSFFGGKKEDGSDPVVIRRIGRDNSKTPTQGLVYNIGDDRYFVSRPLFPFEVASTFTHSDCPGGVKLSATLLFRIIPGRYDSKNWDFPGDADNTGIRLSALSQQLKSRFENFMQQLLNRPGVRIAALCKYGVQGLPADLNFGEVAEGVLPQWLAVERIESVTVEVLLSEEQIRQKEAEAKKRRTEAEIRDIRLEGAVEQAKRDEELRQKEAERQDRLREKKAQVESEKLEGQAEYDKLKLQMQAEYDRLKLQQQTEIDKIRSQQQAEYEDARRKGDAERDKQCNALKIKLEAERVQHQQEINKWEEKLKQLESSFREGQLALQDMQRERQDKAAKAQEEETALRIELLKNDNKLKEIELQKALDEIKKNEELHLAKLEAIRKNENARPAQEQIEREHAKTDAETSEKIRRIEEEQQKIYFDEDPELALDVIRKQQRLHPVALKKEAARSAQESFLFPRNISLNIKSDHIRIGDSMRFSFRSDRAGYLTLICIGSACQPAEPTDAPPQILLLEPNFKDGSPRIEADCTKYFPGSEFLGMELNQDGPAGVERILAIVSDTPLVGLPGGLDDLKELSEGEFKELLDKLEAMPRDTWSAGHLVYRVVD